MTNINYLEHQRNWIGYFIINSLDHEKINGKTLDAKNLKVELKIDGIEFDFVSVVENLGKEFERTVNEKAKKLLIEKMNNDLFYGLDKVADLAYQLNRELEQKVNELFAE